MIHLCGVIIADGGGRIEQDGQQVLLHVADLGGVFLHTVHDKPDMFTGQLQKPGAHDLMWKVAASNPGGFPFDKYVDCSGILQQYIFYYDLMGAR